jgi:hypothetical protein
MPVHWTSQMSEDTVREQRVGGSAAVDYLFGEEHGRLFYEMTLESFGASDAIRTWLHNGGITGTVGDARRSFTLGGSAFWRSNEGWWADAGFRGVNLLASAQMKPSKSVMLSGTYSLYARTFPEQSALDQVEHFGSWRALLNLSTRTTLAGALTLGRKSYDGREQVVMGTTAPAPGGMAARGSAAGNGWRQASVVPVSVETIGAPGRRSEWSWAARVAQSVDDRTGVWLEREQRRTSGDLPPAIVWTPPLFYEDGVYDDPYVIDADTWRAGVKHVFANGAEAGGSGSVSDRVYAGLTRTDRLTRARLETSWPLLSGGSGSLDGVVSYDYFRNSSSDVGESYRAHQFSVGVRLAF